jgi:hypothetical protein
MPSSFCSSFYYCNEYKTRRAVQVLAEKRGVGRGQQIFSGVFGLGAGSVWVYSFVTQKCEIETPDKGPHESY